MLFAKNKCSERPAIKILSAFHCQLKRFHLTSSFPLQAPAAEGCCPPARGPGRVCCFPRRHDATPAILVAFGGPRHRGGTPSRGAG